MFSLVILSKYYSTKSNTLLAESFGQYLLVIFTSLLPFYVARHGCRLLDSAGKHCPEQPHYKGSALYKYLTNLCKNNLKSSTDPNAFLSYLSFGKSRPVHALKNAFCPSLGFAIGIIFNLFLAIAANLIVAVFNLSLRK